MTLERKSLDMEKATFHSHVNQVDIYTLLRTNNSVTLEIVIISDQEIERTDLVNKMTLERKSWDMKKATFHSHVSQVDIYTLFRTETAVTLESVIIWK